MEYPSTQNHKHRVMSSISNTGTGTSLDSCIVNSWKRCLSEYALDPEHALEPQIVEPQDLTERREKSCHLVEMAKSEMTNLYQQVAGSGYSILLTDLDGVVLNYVGDPLFTAAAAKAGMQTGAIWTERAQGTNGIGTCLAEARPLVIHQNEHFFSKNTRLTCSAAPILDPTGRIAGVLDASSESRMAQQHTMVLVNMSAQLIENRLFLCKMRDNFVVRFHSRPEFVSTLGEGTIAFDGSGRIQAINRSALFQLELDSFEQIAGRSIEEIFNLRPEDAMERAARGSGSPQPLRERQHGKRFFGIVQIPNGETTGTQAAPMPKAQRVARQAVDALSCLEFGDTRVRRNIERANKLLDRDIPFMILGETGTGKDFFSKAVHQAGSRRNQPFVAVNCASLPETLIESELFGYRPGAFTGASREGSRGKILQADGGTLFLDEIGDMPLQLQARLLRVLEEREVIPLGSEQAIKVNIHLISATHQDLKQKVMDGSFREDLYYRLHGISLTMPPLRDREDRRELIRHLLDNEAGGPGRISIDEQVMNVMDAYEWPGNIRQLRNVLRTVIGLCDGDRLDLNDLPEEMFENAAPQDLPGARPSNPLDVAERDTIVREMEAAHWNVTRVASKLNLSRNTLYRKMKRFGIQPPR